MFLGSGSLGLPILDRLVALRAGKVVVGTVPDAPKGRRATPTPTPIKVRARELGVPCFEVESLAREHGVRFLEHAKPTLGIVADFRIFLTTRFLGNVPKHCYNLHPSMLPRHRGAAPVARAILAGDTEHGATLYRMVREMDAGPIVAQKLAPEFRGVSRNELEASLAHLCADLVEEWLPRLETGIGLPLREQDPTKVTFAPPLAKREGWVDWSQPAAFIHRHVLAMAPWPRSFATLRRRPEEAGTLIFFDRVKPVAAEHPPVAPGTVLSTDAGTIRLACGPRGTEGIDVEALQRAGGKSLPAAQFLRGTPLAPGDRFHGEETP